MRVKLKILRSDPGAAEEPHYQRYEIDAEPEETVVGALQYICENVDPTLAFRCVCNSQKCAECALVVNGSPCLACDKRVEPEMTIEPLANHRVIRDLVIDRNQALKEPLELLPLLKIPPVADRLETVDQSDVDASVRLTRCVQCLICQSVCPVRAKEPERFAGPLGLVWLAQRSIVDSANWEEKVRKALALCVFCGECWAACPRGANIPGAFFHEMVIAQCRYACPSGIDVPRYIRFIKEGKFAEALAVIRERIPFPMICGRVCQHPCETKCRRGQLDEAVAIKLLKRSAAEYDAGLWKEFVKPAPATGKKVAVVGSGPAGLTAAYYLARRGHTVTVFEALPEPGGMMRFGIPDYRLPRDILDREITEIRNAGVEIRTSDRIESLDRLFDQGYDSVFLGIGAHHGVGLGIEGDGDDRVIECVDLLREVSLGKNPTIGDQVAVIGGGNAAVDAARTALRLGAKDVTVIYRRTRDEMPASPEEVEDALAEGVKIQYLAAPLRIFDNEGRVDLECVRMELGDPGFSGRRQPEPVKGSEFVISFDTVIAAIGQRPDVPISFNLALGRGNSIEVNPDSLATSRGGVFAGGDVCSGPATVIEAIAAGRRAAVSIDRYLGGSGIIDETLAPTRDDSSTLADMSLISLGSREMKPRLPACTVPVAQRLDGFGEVELGFDDEQAIEEATRCLMCDLELQKLLPE